MGIFKKSLAIVLAALMLVSVFTVAAFAEDGPGAGDVPGGSTVVVRGTLPNMGWNSDTDAANTMTEKSGVYSITYDTVKTGTYQFKVVLVDAAGKETWIGTGADGNQNFAIEVSADSDLTITYNAGTQAVDFSGANVSAQSGLTVDKIQVMGTVPGTSWNFDEAAVMTGENDVYTVTLKNVAAGEYQYKFAANGNWDANWGAEADKNGELSGNGVFNSQTNFTLEIGTYNESTFEFEGEAKDVTFKLDLSKFDFTSKNGATYEVTIADAAEEETTAPEEETTAPEEETTAPEEETTEPVEYTTTPEEETTVAPEETTVAPEETTVAPEETTEAPEETTEAPEVTTAPEEETTEPVEYTTTPEEETTAAPEETTAAPEETTAAPEETTAAPEETTVEPEKPLVPGFYLVGSEEVCGLEWENESFAEVYKHSTPMTQASDGTFFKVYDNVKASAGNETEEGNDIYVFKVIYLDAKGNVTWHPGGMGNNTTVTVAEDGSTILFQFKLLANRPTTEGDTPEAVIATVYGPNDEKPSFEDPQYPVAPEETTVAPEETTVAPEETTVAPEETTVAPEETTVAPESTTAPATKVAPVPSNDGKKTTPAKNTTKKTTKKTAKKSTKKSANTVKVKVAKKTVTVKAKSLKKKAFKIKLSKIFKVTKAKGKVTYAKVKGKTAKKIYKLVSFKKGKLVIKKGKLAKNKKGYKLTIKIKAKGTKKFKAKTITKTIKVKVK